MILDKKNIDDITHKDLVFLNQKKLIYKYCSYEVGLNDIILKQSLKFSNPSEYNDPFDCHESLIKLDLMNLDLETFIEKQYPNLSRNIKQGLVRNFNSKCLYKCLSEERKRIKITCFSLNYNNILMWSHYADKHSGICIGFHFHPYLDNFVLTPVKYIDEIPLIDGKVDAYEMIRYWLSIKSDCWVYEEEIRAFTNSKNNNSFELIHYEKNHIKEIIFGCKVSQNEIDQTQKILKSNGFNLNKITFKKMEIDINTFKLKESILLI